MPCRPKRKSLANWQECVERQHNLPWITNTVNRNERVMGDKKVMFQWINALDESGRVQCNKKT